jgi:uncharacterized protein YceK
MKNFITYSLMIVLLSGCVSVSDYRHEQSVEAACHSYKMSAIEQTDGGKATMLMGEYDQCLNRIAASKASNVNLCFGMYFVGGLLTFGILWLLSPICYTAAAS